MLVTGGCGFVGSNLIRGLLRTTSHIRVLDVQDHQRLDSPDFEHVEFIEGDIRDSRAAAGAAEGVSTVVHLAAAGSVVESIADPMANFDNNARGTLSMLDASARANVHKFIFASTGGAIMGNTPPPVNEQSLPWPISPYGASKLCGEAYCHAFAGSYGLNTVALRFANVYGPFSAHKRGAVTRFITAALTDEPITIYGDGSASRDFLYVDDLCDGIVAAIDAPISDKVVHLASGEETSIGDLATQILDITGKSDLSIRYEPQRQGEIEKSFASGAYAEQVLGFSPRTPLRRGLEKTIEWFDANREHWQTIS